MQIFAAILVMLGLGNQADGGRQAIKIDCCGIDIANALGMAIATRCRRLRTARLTTPWPRRITAIAPLGTRRALGAFGSVVALWPIIAFWALVALGTVVAFIPLGTRRDLIIAAIVHLALALIAIAVIAIIALPIVARAACFF